MSPEAPASRKERLLAGSAATALGVFGLVMMYRHPEGLRVPAWVGLPAMSTFVWGGCAILLREHEKTRGLADGAVLLTLIGLFTPAAWIAFGPGPRECTALLAFFSVRAGEWLCRGAFGAGALIVSLMLVLAARQVLTRR
jgi:hypothetical protein